MWWWWWQGFGVGGRRRMGGRRGGTGWRGGTQWQRCVRNKSGAGWGASADASRPPERAPPVRTREDGLPSRPGLPPTPPPCPPVQPAAPAGVQLVGEYLILWRGRQQGVHLVAMRHEVGDQAAGGGRLGRGLWGGRRGRRGLAAGRGEERGGMQVGPGVGGRRTRRIQPRLQALDRRTGRCTHGQAACLSSSIQPMARPLPRTCSCEPALQRRQPRRHPPPRRLRPQQPCGRRQSWSVPSPLG